MKYESRSILNPWTLKVPNHFRATILGCIMLYSLLMIGWLSCLILSNKSSMEPPHWSPWVFTWTLWTHNYKVPKGQHTIQHDSGCSGFSFQMGGLPHFHWVFLGFFWHGHVVLVTTRICTSCDCLFAVFLDASMRWVFVADTTFLVCWLRYETMLILKPTLNEIERWVISNGIQWS